MYICNVLMSLGNKATVTKDSIFTLPLLHFTNGGPLGCNHTAT